MSDEASKPDLSGKPFKFVHHPWIGKMLDRPAEKTTLVKARSETKSESPPFVLPKITGQPQQITGMYGEPLPEPFKLMPYQQKIIDEIKTAPILAIPHRQSNSSTIYGQSMLVRMFRDLWKMQLLRRFSEVINSDTIEAMYDENKEITVQPFRVQRMKSPPISCPTLCSSLNKKKSPTQD